MINGIEHYTEGWSQKRKDEVYARIDAIEAFQEGREHSGCKECGSCTKPKIEVEKDANFTGY